MKPRWYQKDASEKFDIYFRANLQRIENDQPVRNGVFVSPTGSGKSYMLSSFVDLALSVLPGMRVLVLSHDTRIVEQNHSALSKYYDDLYDIGLYAAKLKSRTIKKITVGTINSMFRKPELFENVGLIIVDEAHMINHKDAGMYRKFLDSFPKAVVVGLTATHFRTGNGLITEGDTPLFQDVVVNYSEGESFSRMIKDGHLAKIITKGTEYELDSKNLKHQGGDFAKKQMSDRYDREQITKEVCDEIVRFGKKYKHWLVFAVDTDHADHIARELNMKGIRTIAIHSKMAGDESLAIRAFKAGSFRCAVSVDMLSTGFDYPEIDLIAMVRATSSAVVHVQTAGRGLRPAPGKDHCLYLDFAGNIERLGPINNVKLPKVRGKGKPLDEPIVKKCPQCLAHNTPKSKVCEICGQVFKIKQKIHSGASDGDIIEEDGKSWFNVKDVNYFLHSNPNKPNTMRVTYNCGYKNISEWICLDHHGFPRMLAKNWVAWRLPSGYSKDEIPNTVSELYQISAFLKTPKRILVDSNGKFDRIKEAEF